MINKFIFFFGITGLFVSSCVYYPHLNNIPLIEDKGELQVNAGVSMSPVNTTIVYSPVKHISVLGHGTYSQINKSALIGIGYYNKLHGDYIYEIYSFYNRGYGEGYNNLASDPDLSKNNYYHNTFFNQYAVQFNIGKRIQKKKNIEYAFSIKSYFINSKGLYIQNAKEIDYTTLNIHDEFIGIEPQISFKTGGEHLKFYVQAGYCFVYKLTHKDLDDTGFLMPLNIGIGLCSRFNLNKKSKNSATYNP